MKRVAIQGYKGSFHDMVCNEYFHEEVEPIPADSFDILDRMLSNNEVDLAIMAIENSIAGTLLQNYRILRESNFWIMGEKYLKISHQLLGLEKASMDSIREVHSHPMALNQCLNFLSKYPHIKLVEKEDTALSALQIAKLNDRRVGCIASKYASEVYGLKILAEDIETHKINYTRFFIISNQREDILPTANKSSVYFRIPDQKGQLMKVLQLVDSYDINMSKLQSFPVLGNFREYYFHMDLEFSDLSTYLELKSKLQSSTLDFAELGVYERDSFIPNPELS